MFPRPIDVGSQNAESTEQSADDLASHAQSFPRGSNNANLLERAQNESVAIDYLSCCREAFPPIAFSQENIGTSHINAKPHDLSAARTLESPASQSLLSQGRGQPPSPPRSPSSGEQYPQQDDRSASPELSMGLRLSQPQGWGATPVDELSTSELPQESVLDSDGSSSERFCTQVPGDDEDDTHAQDVSAISASGKELFGNPTPTSSGVSGHDGASATPRAPHGPQQSVGADNAGPMDVFVTPIVADNGGDVRETSAELVESRPRVASLEVVSDVDAIARPPSPMHTEQDQAAQETPSKHPTSLAQQSADASAQTSHLTDADPTQPVLFNTTTSGLMPANSSSPRK
jgi:hypothetical protein